MQLLQTSQEVKDTLKNMTDEEVLREAEKRPAAFEELVDRYEAPFIRKAKLILGSESAAEDAVQDAFVKIYTKSSYYSPQKNATFKSWAYRVLLNTCFSAYQKNKREKVFRARLDPDMAEIIADKAEVEKAEEKIDSEYLLSMISKLPKLLYRTLVLHVYHQKQYKEVAEIEGVSEGVVKTRIHRAKQKLKKASAFMG